MLNARRRQIANAHVDALARRHGIRVRRTKEYHTSEADLSTRQVFIPKHFHAVVDYLAALHELAHIICRAADTRGPDEPSTGHGLRIEAAAWGWAIDHALPEVLAAMTRTDCRNMGFCWASHAGQVYW